MSGEKISCPIIFYTNDDEVNFYSYGTQDIAQSALDITAGGQQRKYSLFRLLKKPILFMQDQLQILSGLSWQEFDKECLKYNMPTKEQAGLKVVMQRFNNK